MSDIHFGKKTATYSPDIFIQRIDRVGKRLQRIRELLSDYEFDKIVFCLLGDANDGSEIYPTQFHHQEITNVDEQADALSSILARFFVWQKETWGNVAIECVPGNHGRAGWAAHEAANWDLVAYKYLALRLQAHGIPVNRNDTSDPFIRRITIRGHNYLLYHGHAIRTYQSIPFYGIKQRLLNWNTTHLAPFDVALMGHFHQCALYPLNRITALLSGTMATSDEWALQVIGAESMPLWWMFGISDHRPITWQFRIELD